jgi:multisubunit Na+/H+ antiporter MnhC subunit
MTPSGTITAGTNHSRDGLSSMLLYTNPNAHLIVSTALVVHTAAVQHFVLTAIAWWTTDYQHREEASTQHHLEPSDETQ